MWLFLFHITAVRRIAAVHVAAATVHVAAAGADVVHGAALPALHAL
jgi:hypothetical protein